MISSHSTLRIEAPRSGLLWMTVGCGVAVFAAADTAIAYMASPWIALGVPVVVVATIYFFYRPMVGVYAALLCVPAEALNLSFGSFWSSGLVLVYSLEALVRSVPLNCSGAAPERGSVHSWGWSVSGAFSISRAAAKSRATVMRETARRAAIWS